MVKTFHYLNPFARHSPQKPQLCGATTIKIALDTRGIDAGYFGSEDLAYYIGSRIDENDAKSFRPKLRTRALKSGSIEIGLLFEDFEKPELQKMLKAKYNLDTRVYHLSEITHIEKFLCENIDANNSIIANFRWEPFRGGKNEGHFVVAVAYDEKNKELYVADPSPINPEYWKDELQRFVYGMQPVWEETDGKTRERGFIVFSGPICREKDNPQEIESLLKDIPTYEPPKEILVREQRSIPLNHRGQKLRKRDLDKIIVS